MINQFFCSVLSVYKMSQMQCTITSQYIFIVYLNSFIIIVQYYHFYFISSYFNILYFIHFKPSFISIFITSSGLYNLCRYTTSAGIHNLFKHIQPLQAYTTSSDIQPLQALYNLFIYNLFRHKHCRQDLNYIHFYY